MSCPVLIVTVPGALSPVLGTALSLHPGLVIRDGADIDGFRSNLDTHTRARSKSDQMPWAQARDWVDDLVEAEVRRLATPEPGRLTVWRARDPHTAATTARALGAVPVVWIADGRHGLPSLGPPTDSGDRIEQTAWAGHAWEAAASTAEALPGALHLTRETQPAAVLAALGVASHGPTEDALELMRHLGTPGIAPVTAAAFGACPAAARRLRRLGQPTTTPPAHPVVTLLHARDAAAAGRLDDARVQAMQILAEPSSARVRSGAIELLIEAGATDDAMDAYIVWIRETDHALAWAGALSLAEHPRSGGVARRARRHGDPEVRSALARWLVHHGLDPQAAETVASVRGLPWYRPAPHHR